MLVDPNSEKGMHDDQKEKMLPSPPLEQAELPPPAYNNAAGPSRGAEPTGDSKGSKELFAPDDPSFLTPPANFVSINAEARQTINDAWTIDTTLVPPPWLLAHSLPSSSLKDKDRMRQLMEIEKDGTGAVSANGKLLRPNLRLKAEHGKIEAAVRIVNGTKTTDPAVIVLQNTWGIKLAVPFRGVQKIYIKATCGRGPIEIRIPRDFFGFIYSQAPRGSLNLSNDVIAVSTTFSLSKSGTRTFVGNWQEMDWSRGDPSQSIMDPEAISWADPGTTASPLGDLDTLVMEGTWAKMSVSFVDE